MRSSSVHSAFLTCAILCLGLAPAQAVTPRLHLAEDELVFSELECHAEEGATQAAFFVDKASLSFPLRIQAMAATRWVQRKPWRNGTVLGFFWRENGDPG